jgi:acyl-CoA dehydrogenase
MPRKCMVLDAARRRDNKEDISTGSVVLQAVRFRNVRPRGRPLGADPRRRGLCVGIRGERFYRDVRLFRIYEGTSQIQQLVIARNMIRAAQQ